MAEESVIQADNLGAFYKHVNQRVRHRDAIATLTDDDGLVVTSDVKKADMFNEYFASVGVADNGKSLQNVQHLNRLHLMNIIYCSLCAN